MGILLISFDRENYSFCTGYSGDYALIFGKNASKSGKILWPTVVTEFNAFTVCLWYKLYVQEESSRHHHMTLLRYMSDDGNFTLYVKDFNDDDGPTLSLVIWPRYDFDSLSSGERIQT